MTELQRLLDGNSDELALALLRSAGDDSPSTDSLKAAAVVLGIGTGLGGSVLLASGLHTAAAPGASAAGGALSQAAVAAAPAASAGAAITFGAVAKQVALGLVAGLFAMGGLELALDRPLASNTPALATHKAAISPARTTPQLRATGPSVAALSGPTADSLEGDPAQAAAPAGANEGAPVHPSRRRSAILGAAPAPEAAAEVVLPAAPELVAVEAKPAPESAKPQPAIALNKSLAAEVALLDRARSALLSQNPSGALRTLEQYRKERQTAILDPEATVLQIQVLEKLGEHAAAARLARQFIASHPASRHVDSLRVLAAEAP